MRDKGRLLFASMAGTAIEFFDFYIYANAAVLAFPRLFFPKSSSSAAVLQSLATFSLAFFARPVGSVLFGHFGDRIGRKATLVASLLTMGISTVAIGLLPTYATAGVAAPLLLALCRVGQGLGLGGEWGGAILLATEHAPEGKRGWYGMFPQLGAPVGFLCAGTLFWLLSHVLTDGQFLAFGWRIPFVASSVLVLVGMYVRLRVAESPVFQRALEHDRRVAVPMLEVCRSHLGTVVRGGLVSLATFLLFYILTVFCLSWGTSKLGYSRQEFLLVMMIGVVFFGATIPWSAAAAEKHGRRLTLVVVTVAIGLFGLFLGPLLSLRPHGALITMVLGFFLMGITYGPLGTVLSELFPTPVRYTGASLSFNLAGILGGSLAPAISVELATRFGLQAVGYYLAAAALITLGALAATQETRGTDLDGGAP